VAEQTGMQLQSRLVEVMGTPVRVHNAAFSAHTTQDSLNKFTCLTERGAEFDLILIYHGINDVRMNCVAAEDFRNDYTHCAWYASFNKRKREGGISARDSIRESLDRMIGLGPPSPDHAAFGAQIKTGPAFRDHLEQILKIADQQNTPVVLMTFATHFVDDYSRDAFLKKQLGYAGGPLSLPTEIWGESDNVKRGVAVHNDVIRQLATERPQSLFIDMNAELTGIEHFTDVCHLSSLGTKRFTDIVSAELPRALMPEEK
jgi:lysophospholipase L1-like esterase